MLTSIPDSVERDVVIQAPIEQVFAALTDPNTYPTWGPLAVEGRMEAGEKPILDFGEQGGGKTRVYVVAVDPPTYFAFRWMQGEFDPEVLVMDPLERPTTLVEFRLDEDCQGTRVTVKESGIAALPGMADLDPEGAKQSAAMMSSGWSFMLGGLARHFEGGEDKPRDRVENRQLVKATPDQVFDALIHPTGWWVQAVNGEFAAGNTVELDKGPYGKWVVEVVSFEPGRLLSYRRADTGTLIEFNLEPVEEGTMVHQVESPFGPEDEQQFLQSSQIWGIILQMLAMKFDPS